jgi:hypothetical protein
MMKPPGGVEAFTWARAALSVPGPPVAPLDEVPGVVSNGDVNDGLRVRSRC